jgi:hypothetical protein
MSKKQRTKNRKCSALLAAGVGAAVCMTGGSPAHAVNGLVSATNGTSVFNGVTSIYLFGFKAAALLISPTMVDVGGSLSFVENGTGKFLNRFSSVTISSGLYFGGGVASLSSTSNTYIGMSFNDGGTKYGWVRVVDYTNPTLTISNWSYNNSVGGSIKTLSDSVTTSRLALSDGKEKLHWSNDNEDGVARYEVQSKDATGAWQAADSDVPGSGSYSAKVDSGKICRLVVEMTDGSTKEIAF